MFRKPMKRISSSNDLSARVDAILDTRIAQAGATDATWMITSALNGLLASLASAEAAGVPRAILDELLRPARLQMKKSAACPTFS